MLGFAIAQPNLQANYDMDNFSKFYHTIYVDYSKGIVVKGPDLPLFIYDFQAKVQPISSRKFLLYQGQRKVCVKSGLFCPTRYSYIIEVKK